METKNKTILVIAKGTLLTFLIGIIATGGGVIRLEQGGAFMTMKQYGDLRDMYFQKYENHEVFTVQEFQLFAIILNREMQRLSIHQLQHVDKDTLIFDIINKTKTK